MKSDQIADQDLCCLQFCLHHLTQYQVGKGVTKITTAFFSFTDESMTVCLSSIFFFYTSLCFICSQNIIRPSLYSTWIPKMLSRSETRKPRSVMSIFLLHVPFNC